MWKCENVLPVKALVFIFLETCFVPLIGQHWSRTYGILLIATIRLHCILSFLLILKIHSNLGSDKLYNRQNITLPHNQVLKTFEGNFGSGIFAI